MPIIQIACNENVLNNKTKETDRKKIALNPIENSLMLWSKLISKKAKFNWILKYRESKYFRWEKETFLGVGN